MNGQEDVVHMHNGILYRHKKNEILPFVKAWIVLEGIMLNEISQKERDKYYMWVKLQYFQNLSLGLSPFPHQ